MPVERVVSGAELARLTPEQLTRAAQDVDVFVKLSPVQKEQIVQALQRSSHVVGFMGDGINDAPALKAADVGISVDSAVDVAKEAADIVLLEKSLLVLEEGIIEGRKVFANITKYIRMGASSNFGNMFSVVGASYLLPFLPMQPVQILTNNLLYDVSQTGIPSDRVDEELVARPLHWNIGNIKRFMVFIGPISSIFDYATFALMWFLFQCSRFGDAVPRGRTAPPPREPVPDGVVRRIAVDPDPDRPHHPNEADTVHREPGVAGDDVDHGGRDGHRRLAALLAVRRRARAGRPPSGLLGLDRRLPPGLWRHHPRGEDLVHETVRS